MEKNALEGQAASGGVEKCMGAQRNSEDIDVDLDNEEDEYEGGDSEGNDSGVERDIDTRQTRSGDGRPDVEARRELSPPRELLDSQLEAGNRGSLEMDDKPQRDGPGADNNE